MPVQNADIAAVLEEIADLLEIQDANPFRIRAYRNAARSVGEYGRSFASMTEAGEEIPHLPGIGADLAAKIREIAVTGKCQLLDELRRQLPPAITELLHLPGLGPKRVSALWHALDVQTLEQLHRAALDGRIRELPGFGDKTEAKILQAVEARMGTERRFRLAVAGQYAEALTAYLRKSAAAARRVEIAGSFRRMRETVGDLDVLVTAGRGSDVMERLKAYEDVAEVLSIGPTRASVVLRNGLQVDVRLVEEASYGSALCYFTGSKAHNIHIRRLAQERGLKINEYGVFRDSKRIAGETEESVYRTVGLPFIAPELREDRGEIEAARAGALPKLVELSDLQGDLHVHTVATDGRGTLREMADAARAAGLKYIAITEHSRRLAMAKGLDAARLLRQCDEIDELNGELKGITLLKGIEVDILDDGKLDLPDSALAKLDVVIGAVHSAFDLSRTRQTERILRAMDNRYFGILAHPTGRLIDRRAPYDVDMTRIIRHAKARGCALEVNAHPERLDLLDTQCRAANEAGVLIAINSDAHSTLDFANLRFGVGQARRGWIEAKDVLNARPLAQLTRFLAKLRA
ncbi:DNA polymerase/3'-5' exonuclease PolX [Aromatoleum bremense]|uniref:DNA polymerase beta n=1 Tax=Aromatoleum bremense TaxID=76115 RepID=A0ABX1NUG7_9RHOO|nr:DNA polymerase/3'-5' exonuclease PolX [Aromatoleum bremense]NMG15408.1 DNA polymerase/3'-5' exonuclease PolX [Aromatoleum bremense]QTQ34055.1 Putative DNA polymerase III [Aromatoleum bremense]